MTNDTHHVPDVELGRVVLSRGVASRLNSGALPALWISAHLILHRSGHWGEVDEEDKRANDAAVQDGGRLLSVYVAPDGVTRVWVITEADRSITTVLFPDEY